MLDPGASLSLQMNHHRAEHWAVVIAASVVEKDEVAEPVCENQSTSINLGENTASATPVGSQ